MASEGNKNLKISLAKVGMNKDTHPSQLDKTQYTFAYNANLENESGNLLNLMNEKSNILASKFKSGFVVHGFENDPSTGNTLFFLLNPTTGVGEFGEIINNQNTNDLNDLLINCKDCDYAMELAEPLETVTQTALQTYDTLISDETALYLNPIDGTYSCYNKISDPEYTTYNLGFNFNIDYPIKSIVIKNEKTGKKVYFTDNYNPPRYIDYTNLDNYKIQEVSCAPDDTTTCINFEELRIFKFFSIPEITPVSIAVGGNLRLGVYEFLISYCDAAGNEISPYYSITNPISIFDKNNTVLSQENLADRTNFAIKLDIQGLDKKYTNYKIAVIQTADIEGATRYYIEGIHNISDNTVVYDTEKNKVTTTIDKLVLPKLDVEKTEALEASNNILFHTGITIKKEINLQPVVNLLGEFLQWQTHIAPENLYEDGVAISKYLGYGRDEVVPFSIRFGLSDGYETALFPFVGRSPKESDLISLVDEDGNVYEGIDEFKDVNSILSNKQVCTESLRTKKWQYYNTATLDEDNPNCTTIDIETQDSIQVLDKFCIVESATYPTTTPILEKLYSIPSGKLIIEDGESYTDLITYINDNKAYCPGLLIAPKLTFDAPNTSLEICDFLEDHYGDCLEDPFEGIVDENGFPLCGTPEVVSTELLLTEVIGEVVVKEEKQFPDDYIKIVAPKLEPLVYELDPQTGNPLQDPENPLGYNPTTGDDNIPVPVYTRNSSFENETCSYAKDVTQATVMSPNENLSYFHNYHFSDNSKNLVSNKITNLVDYVEEVTFKNATSGSTSGDLIVTIGVTTFSQTYVTSPTASALAFFTAHETAIEALTGGVVTVSGPTITITNSTLTYIDSVTTTGTLEYEFATTGGFTNKLQKGALWYKLDFEDNTELILDISKEKLPKKVDSLAANTKVRVSIFTSCSATTAIYSKIVDLTSSSLYKIKKASSTSLDLIIEDETTGLTPITITNGWSLTKKYYIAIDCPLVKTEIDTDPLGVEVISGFPPTYDYHRTFEDRFYIDPIRGCYTVTKRPIEIERAEIFWDSIELVKKITMRATCTFKQPIVQNCKAIPYKKGNFAYWESTEIYPDNNELYNSSTLKIKEADLATLSLSEKLKFEEIFVNGEDSEGNYEWKESEKVEGDVSTLQPVTDYTCRPIRHFKFPDNKVAPYMYTSIPTQFSRTPIFPLGVTINEEVILTFLDIAVKNGLLSSEDRSKIRSYEIFRGDLNLNRSVVASGILFDMRSYKENTNTNTQVLYSNYPFNTYSDDKMNLDSSNKPLATPNFGDSNYNYTFHSPETDYYRPTLPSEISLQGFLFGNSRGNVEEVQKHPKWVILGKEAKNQAEFLATAEVVAEGFITIANQTIQSAQAYESTYFFFGGAGVAGGSVTANPIGIGMTVAALATTAFLQVVESVLYKWGRYRYEWMKIFRDLGTPNNFAYYYHAEGYYNYFKNEIHTDGDSLRGVNVAKYLKDARYTTTNEVDGAQLIINNIDREKSVFLSLGVDHSISYPAEYSNFDKVSTDSSLTYLGENGLSSTKKSQEIVRNVASPYVYLKNYIPSQHGTINSVKWISSGFRSDFNNTGCLSIFGGDTFISRHTVKRKKPQFLVTAMDQADLTPFNYYFYNNIGDNPKFYASYEINKDFKKGSSFFPDIEYNYNFDNADSIDFFGVKFKTSPKYISPPNKFYLYYYGVPNYLVETRINTNFRYAGKELRDNFFPQVGDLSRWTQEKNVPINEPETFNYNNSYSKQTSFIRTRVFSNTYKKEINDRTQNLPNGVISSLSDSSENSTMDPWLIYRPFDLFEFPTNFGKLKDIIDIESQAVLARFENTSMLYNKVDSKIDDGSTPTTAFFGGASLWQRRPITFNNTDLGYGGTQNFAKISCEYGHFWVDAKRGQVLTVQPNGGTMEEISSVIGGKPSGMRNWFKEHLPFKILKHVPNADTDNPYNGAGITMGWDSRYRRVFITKKDYIPKSNYIKYYKGQGYFYDPTIAEPPTGEAEFKVELYDNQYFEDVSWTVAYSPVIGSWLSYYSFTPNYYIGHNNYFQTGINSIVNTNENGLWSHLLTNKSYQVFYGKKEEFILEYPVQGDYTEKYINNIELWTEAKRYHNDYDYYTNPGITFNKSVLYNTIHCSGTLNLVPLKTNYMNAKDFPKTNLNNTQDIGIRTGGSLTWTYDYFYNRVKNGTSNIPFLIQDSNQIKKYVNSQIVSFKGKPLLERMVGDWFLNRLTYDKDSRYSLSFIFSITDTSKI